jgi:hypothetical protein
MKRLAIVLVLAACSRVFGEAGNGQAARDARHVPAFDSIDLGGAVDAEVAIGSAASVEVSGDANLVARVTTEVHGSELQIRTNGAFRPKLPLVVHVVTPTLVRLAVSGAGNAKLAGARGDRLAIDVGGAGNVTADGQVAQLAATVSGAGNIKAADLHAEHDTAKVGGAGDIDVFASASLDADVSGAGSIRYAGNPPDVKKHVSGAGSISPK